MAPRCPLRPVENWIISYFVIIKAPDPPWPRWCWLFSHARSGSPTFTITFQTKRFTIFYDEKQETHASNITKDMRKQIVQFSRKALCQTCLSTTIHFVETLALKSPVIIIYWACDHSRCSLWNLSLQSGCRVWISGAMLSSPWMEAIRQIKATWSKYYSADPVRR